MGGTNRHRVVGRTNSDYGQTSWSRTGQQQLSSNSATKNKSDKNVQKDLAAAGKASRACAFPIRSWQHTNCVRSGCKGRRLGGAKKKPAPKKRKKKHKAAAAAIKQAGKAHTPRGTRIGGGGGQRGKQSKEAMQGRGRASRAALLVVSHQVQVMVLLLPGAATAAAAAPWQPAPRLLASGRLCACSCGEWMKERQVGVEVAAAATTAAAAAQ